MNSLLSFVGFRYKEDLVPVLLILGVFITQLAVFFFLSDWRIVAVVEGFLLIPQMSISAFNHHHAHLNTFNRTFSNHILNTILGLHTGIVTMGWVLHHNLGHHRNYLDQDLDQSRWRRRSGERMGVAEYVFGNYLRMYPEMFAVALKHPTLLRKFLLQIGVSLSLLAFFAWFNPVNTLILFVIPMLVKPPLTFLATYFQHAGLEPTDHHHASYNNLQPSYNAFFWNLGYHSAHHIKPGLHWSVLPEFHREIEKEIPGNLIVTDAVPWSWFDRKRAKQ